VATVDVDRLLRDRLYLQRYVTSLLGDVEDTLAPQDRALLDALARFVEDADDRALGMLARQRASHPAVRDLLARIRETLAAQRAAALELVAAESERLAERSVRVTAGAIALEGVPSSRGVATLPIGGALIGAIVGAALGRYGQRLLSEVTEGARVDPRSIVARVRGTPAERRRDGLLWWRRERALRPAVDTVVNGVASNARVHAYTAGGVEMLDWLATLDFKTCPTCLAREVEGPYPIATAPRPQAHPNCRCEIIPAQPDGAILRPFVRDHRSVKDIPKSERTGGKIGQTREPIEAFFRRMTSEQRRRYMGAGPFALWEAGKVTDLRQLVAERSLRPLRLDELPD